jgi:diguanylate cyclase (GGDEF)-like protein
MRSGAPNARIAVAVVLCGLLCSLITWVSCARAKPRASAASQSADVHADAAGVVLSLELIRPKTARISSALEARGLPLPELSELRGPQTFWTRLSLRAETGAPQRWLLTPDRGWRHVDVFDERGGPLMRTGANVPLWQRPFVQGVAVLPLVLRAHNVHTYVLRFEGNLDGWEPPLGFLSDIAPEASALYDARCKHLALGLYAGLLLAIAFVNVLFAGILRDRIYVDYLLYAVPYALIWLTRDFVGAELFWPDAPWIDNRVLFMAICAAIVLGNRFAARFLSLPDELPALHRALLVIDACVAVGVVLGMLSIWRPVSPLLGVTTLATCVVYLLAGVLCTLRGSRSGRYFLAANGAMALGTIIYTLRYFQLIPAWPFTASSAQIGSALEMMLLALALGDRVRGREYRRKLAEQRLRKDLEHQVERRTAELASANSELVEVNRRLERLSLTDPLTGLANRRHFQSTLQLEWQRALRERSPLSLMLVDVDLFKDYNDEYGHQAGDDCLLSVARVLVSGTRRALDLVARYGGEEFILVLPGMSESAAQAHAEHLRKAIADSQIVHARSSVAPFVTVSIGIASREGHAGAALDSDASYLITRADWALYRAKRKGRNQVARASSALESDPGELSDTGGFHSGAFQRSQVLAHEDSSSGVKEHPKRRDPRENQG